MLRILIVAVLAITTNSLATEASAQTRRPRFFQRIKQDLFGGTTQTPQQIEQAKRAAAAKQQQLRAQQAQKTAGRVPTPVRQQTPTVKKPSVQSQYNGRPSSQRQPATTAAPSRSPSHVPAAASSVAYKRASKSNGKGEGFGFGIVLAGNDKLIVSTVDRVGNGVEAGLRRGDQLLEIGGIEATSVEEFEEIAKIMGQGDEMEFKIKRGSKESDVRVRYGKLPELEEVQGSETSQSTRSTTGKRYDFAPPNTSEFQQQSNSVLNRSNGGSQAQPTGGQTAGQIQKMNSTIREQNRQIQQLQREIQLLRSGTRPR